MRVGTAKRVHLASFMGGSGNPLETLSNSDFKIGLCGNMDKTTTPTTSGSPKKRVMRQEGRAKTKAMEAHNGEIKCTHISKTKRGDREMCEVILLWHEAFHFLLH
jgi:hypothetical protein